jgi:Mrp family chromosome partitioning ATPase
MNALDKAFIRAYSKGTDGAAATAVLEESELGAERAAAASQNRAAAEVSRLSPLVEVYAADGVWYRIEQPRAEAQSPPAPHAVFSEQRGSSDSLREWDTLDARLQAESWEASSSPVPHASAAETMQPRSPAPAVRYDSPHAPSERSGPQAPATAMLPESELNAFLQGAEASVVTQGWDVCVDSDAFPEALCQCFIAGEELAAPVVIDRTWIDVRSPAPETPAAEAAASPAPDGKTPEAKEPEAESLPETRNEAPSLPAFAARAPVAQETKAPAPLPEAPSTKTADVAAKPAPAAKAFHPAWEVDRLTWPEACDQLARGDAFGPLAKTVLETARRGKKVIAITGVGRGEGRTTLALCLARRVAKEGIDVALLDADFERPHLGRRVGIDMENGWDDVLTDGQPLSEAAVSSLEDNLTILPLGRRAAALVSAHTAAALRQASAAFEVVLVDMGPVNEEETADPPGEGASPVAALVVADQRHATEESTSKAIERLQAAGIETLGVVETFA